MGKIWLTGQYNYLEGDIKVENVRAKFIAIALLGGIAGIVFSYELQFNDNFIVLNKLSGCIQISSACLPALVLQWYAERFLPCYPHLRRTIAVATAILLIIGIVWLFNSSHTHWRWITETMWGIGLSFLFSICILLEKNALKKKK